LNEGDAPVDIMLVTVKEKRRRFKRVLIAGGVTLCLFCLLFGTAYLWLSSGSRQSDEHKVTADASSSNKANEQTQGITAEEISRELNKHTANNNESEQISTNQIEDSSSTSNNPNIDRLPNEDLSSTVNSNETANRNVNDVAANSSNSSSQNTAYSNKATSNTESANNPSSLSSSQNNSSFVPTRSIQVGLLQSDKEKKDERTLQSSSSTKTANINQTTFQRNQTAIDENQANCASENTTTRKNNVSVPLPPFGTMLPVRTVGTVFTLRSDSYVRLELIRDISGQGWTLKRGTEFYGTVRGADIETSRVFISITGFIDPNINRFVRLQGSVMGSDGADGARGKKHKLNSGWVNALKKVGAEILDTAKSAATGIGRRPIIITNTSPGIVDPIAEEISGLVVNKNGFVEILAGTACYVLVTILPNETQGVDADVSLPNVSSSKANQSTNQNQLSEEELADLLTDGDKEEIRLAFPRMSPQMRRVAEAFLANK